MKYIYKTVPSKIREVYEEHTGVDIFKDGEYPIPATLIIEADSEEECYNLRILFSHIHHWELERIDES